MTTLLLATTNPGKIREIVEILRGLPITIQTLDDYPGLAVPEETGETFGDNARQKALYYASRSGAMTVAEDSGLEIDALDRGPGVHSARYGGAESGYPEKFERIYSELSRAPSADRTARFVCALALARGEDIMFEAEGVVEGQIAPEPRGTGGFGYDPIFFYPPFSCTLAEAGARKSTVSHRGQAFRRLRDYLLGAGGSGLGAGEIQNSE